MTELIHKSISNKGEGVRDAQRQGRPATKSKSGVFATLPILFCGPGGGAPSHRRYLPIATALALALTMALISSPAFAAETHPPLGFSPITGSGSGVTIGHPTGLAIDEGSGNVFLNNSEEVTDILGAEGGVPVGLVSPFQLTGFSFGIEPSGVAFDNSATSPSKGTLYVVAENEVIRKFTRNPETERYEEAGHLTYPGSTAVVGATVDSRGDLFVSDAFGTESIYEFDPAGDQIAQIHVTESLGVASAVAVDSAGDLFLRRAGGEGSEAGVVFKYPANGSGEVEESAFTEIPTGAGVTDLTVDRAKNALYVLYEDHVVEYDATSLAKEREFGSVLHRAKRIAVNSATGRIYVADESAEDVGVFGALTTVPTVSDVTASNIIGKKAELGATIDPEDIEVNECKFEYGTTAAYGETRPCEGQIPTDPGEHPVSATIGGLTPNATYHYRVVARNPNGVEIGVDHTFVTAGVVSTGAATAVSPTGATVNGTVHPEGEPVSECRFEYGTTSAYESSAACEPSAGSLAADFEPHPVHADLTGLASDTTYHFRLVITNTEGPSHGGDKTFTTTGPPQIIGELARPVGRTEATLRAKINPSGFATKYYFEWGTDASHGNRVPVGEDPAIGSGTAPIEVSAAISGLQEASVYHFRVVAINSSGTTPGSDQELMTLNSADLPDDRRPELVSPENKRPVGTVQSLLGRQVKFQAAEEGNAITYPILNGLADSTAGGEVAYEATRSSAGWNSVQVTAPSLVSIPESAGAGSASSGRVDYYTPGLSCGITETNNPLSADVPSADAATEVINLFRWNPTDQSYTLISNRIPLNPTAQANGVYYEVMGANESCTRIFFRSTAYEFLPGASGLYEWDEGTLSDAGLLPDRSTAAGTEANGDGFITDQYRVSRDGRLFFMAISDEGADAGHQAVFVRKSKDDVVDASQSSTATPGLGAQYEAASPDGSDVLFLANYGLSSLSSSGPREHCIENLEGGNSCDLYAYDVDSEQLTDISADPNPADPAGAEVEGVLDVSEDGSTVYFAAKGQLITEQGHTYAQNLESGSANVYRAHAGRLSYVSVVTAEDLILNGTGALIRNSAHWTSQTTRDGQYLLYVSSADLDGANPAEVPEAYIYSAATETTECISCRPDGQAPHPPSPGLNGSPIISHMVASTGFQSYVPRSLSDDGRAFFTTEEALTPDAVEGHGGTNAEVHNNIYEWHDGQVSLLAAGHVRVRDLGGPHGEDVFITTDEHLDPRDIDTQEDIYDLRAGGGFPPPPAASPPCDPSGGACQGPPAAPPASATPATPGLSGPGNLTSPAPKKHKHHKKHRHPKQHRRRQKHHKKKVQVKPRDKRAEGAHSRTDSSVNFNRGGAK
jgi:hypothetical protein